LIVELLVSFWGHCRTNSQKRKASGTGRIATSFNNAQALKMHNLENWIIYHPFKQAAIVQRLLKLSENFKDHCTHH